MRLICCSVLVVAVFLVFGQVARHEFLMYDDADYITANPVVTGGLTLENIITAFTTFQNANWHPVTLLSHMLDVQLFGLNPTAHHLENVVLHATNAILLLLALNRLTGALFRSAAVAALFALHPLHVESVAWITERKDVLSTAFWLLIILLYPGYAARPRVQRYLTLLGLFALGLMAKPMLVTLPFTLLLLDYWPLQRQVPTGNTDTSAGTATERGHAGHGYLFAEKIPFLLLAIGAGIMTMQAQQHSGAIHSLAGYLLPGRVANALVSTATYLANLVWPTNLAVFYPYPTTLPLWKSAGAAVLLAAISAVTVWQMRQRPYLLFGWLWYLITLAPVAGILQVGLQARADRYTYVPLIGIFIMVVWGGAELMVATGRHRCLWGGVAGGIIGVYAIVAWQQVHHWQSTETLFTHALSVTADNAVARFNLGLAYGTAGRFEEARKQFARALQLPPVINKTHYNLGLALHRLGRLDEAISHYTAELERNPGHEDSRYNLAIAREQLARTRQPAAAPPDAGKAR
jgi:tetratricopeptide (TPR) repeat protein